MHKVTFNLYGIFPQCEKKKNIKSQFEIGNGDIDLTQVFSHLFDSARARYITRTYNT